jgi:hypothetical protein
LDEVFNGPDGQVPDDFQGFFPIRGVDGVSEVEEVLVGEQGGACPQNADTSQAGVKEANGAVLLVHRDPSFPSSFGYLVVYHFFRRDATGFFQKSYGAGESLLTHEGGEDGAICGEKRGKRVKNDALLMQSIL